jgi:alkylation response protein AidB-like acyl-CoA dehydrogenase
VVPNTEVEFEDTWYVAGMRGTGSNAIVVKDLFIPEHRIANTFEMVDGNYPYKATDDEPLYRTAWSPLLAIVLVGPQLGLAREALRLVMSQAAKRPISLTFYAKEKDSAVFQSQIARAAMLIDTAHLHAYRAAKDIDVAASEGYYPNILARARVRADTGWVAEHVQDAIRLLVDANGAGSYAESNPLQRIWRDSAVGGHHALVQPAVGYETYGRELLEVEDRIVPFI